MFCVKFLLSEQTASLPPVLLQVLAGACLLHPTEVSLLQGIGRGFDVSRAGRKVLFLLHLASGLHVLREDLRSLPGFGSRGEFVRPLHQNTVGTKT